MAFILSSFCIRLSGTALRTEGGREDLNFRKIAVVRSEPESNRR